MGFARDGHALAQHVLLVGRLDLAQVGENRRRVHHVEPEEALAELCRELGRGPRGPREVELRLEEHRELRAAVGQRLEEPRRLSGRTSLGAFREHGGHERLELIRGHDRLDAGRGRGLLGRQAVPVPVLSPCVRLAHEEHFLAGLVARHQHEDRVFLIEAGEVEQVAVLPVLVLDVGREDPHRRAPEDGDGVRTEAFHGARAPRLEIVLKRTAQCRPRDQQHQQSTGEDRACFAHDCGAHCTRIAAVYRPSGGVRRKGEETAVAWAYCSFSDGQDVKWSMVTVTWQQRADSRPYGLEPRRLRPGH